MKRYFMLFLSLVCILVLPGCDPDENVDAKPVIYLYPETTTEVSVKLEYQGELTCTYPEYKNGWHVAAQPDGTLTDIATQKEYSYLFWEGLSEVKYDMSNGYVVKGSDTAEFLQNILAEMGLTPKEYNEFIVYWLPKMQENPYNLITFQTDVYTENALLKISPEPDSILRVFMAYEALEKPVTVEEPFIEPFTRSGFTVVEWGGTEIK
ncbi:hypothetical protein ACPWSR_08320 [Alloiococcus sp. CFN-8]|uniref:hypothetical protein n=1 Tax=Alloiococcus sp. CFN-8 TaxID=3416081 RepID=UPI003CEB7DD7